MLLACPYFANVTKSDRNYEKLDMVLTCPFANVQKCAKNYEKKNNRDK